jgi:hypothetical protein
MSEGTKTKYLFTIIRDNESKGFVSRDNKLRSFLLWGNMNHCVKTYKSKGFAQRKAEKLGLNNFTLFHLYNDTIEKFQKEIILNVK